MTWLTGLNLRLRVLLFFVLLAVGNLAILCGALYVGYARVGVAEAYDGFVFSGVLAGFLLVALSVGVWLLFDENLSRPIERLAVDMRARAHAGVNTALDLDTAKYLGDLAPAAQAVTGRIVQDQTARSDADTQRLEDDHRQLAALLSDIPLALVILSPEHRIVLYDGQAAAILGEIAPPRLNASLFDYVDRDTVLAAHSDLSQGHTIQASLPAIGSALTLETRLIARRSGPGYILILDDSHLTLSASAPRPLTFDFDLPEAPDGGALDATPLNDLCFTVFDTETTGLMPKTDAIVQIGAVRILRGSVVAGESLDLFVNPGRPIPAASTKVHRITDAMVDGASPIEQAGRTLFEFARDAVLVAHNAPFDMGFLMRDADLMGVQWDHPVLDTVLVSAVLFGTTDTHTLDALCERLDVTIPESERHTALGDARATAQVLCKMLPMLQARGLNSWGDIITETRKHRRLLRDLN